MRRSVSPSWETQVLRANRRFPDPGVPHERRGIVGVYDVGDDWVPIDDRTDLDGDDVAIGTSGDQLENAGAAGQVTADLIEAVEAGHDHDDDPLRTVGRHTGRPIDSSSSMSVQG